MRRIGMVLAAGATLVAAAACSRPAAPVDGGALRADLDAAQSAATRPAAGMQFVSPLERGRAAGPAPEAPAPVRSRRSSAPARVAVARRASTPTVERVARPAARVRAADPEPARVREIDDVADEPAEQPSAEPARAPAQDEPVVAAPSRRPDVESPPPPRRRGRVWDMGDVIRNAPFPINP